MKSNIQRISMMAVIVVAAWMMPAAVFRAQAQGDVSFQLFYDQLSPYGSWVSYPDYGYVWVPGVEASFRPYGTRGHWVYTDDGWLWVSDYEWGWATFHYGNWFYDDAYGWMWAPGYTWAPAWVTWGEYQGNYCWAPVGPRVDMGVSYSTYRPPARYWNFCPRERIMSVNVSNYYVRNVHTTTVINNITVINNVNRTPGRPVYLRGPQAANVERFTHQNVRPVAVRTVERPGAVAVRNGQVAIYRPNVQNNNASARPAQVRDMQTLQRVNGRGASPSNRPTTLPRAPQQAQRGEPAQRPVMQPGQRSARPMPSQPGQRPAIPIQQQQPGPTQQEPRRSPQQRPSQQPPPQQSGQRPTAPPPQQQQPRPAQQQPGPTQQEPRRSPQQQRPPQQPPPQQPGQRPTAPLPPQQQPRPTQQPRPSPQQPRSLPQQGPRPNPAPRPAPPPHQPVQRPTAPPHQNAPHPEHRR